MKWNDFIGIIGILPLTLRIPHANSPLILLPRENLEIGIKKPVAGPLAEPGVYQNKITS
jgi:hypothetical protein